MSDATTRAVEIYKELLVPNTEIPEVDIFDLTMAVAQNRAAIERVTELLETLIAKLGG